MRRKPNTSTAECRRCGTCCRKGGPCIHVEDRVLIENGSIPLKFLYTIRPGELAYDHMRRALLPVTADIVKIKGQDQTWRCVFHNDPDSACRIYEKRPVECRSQKCWDTREIENIYTKNRLTRKDLLEGVNGLWELIEDHENRCSYLKLARLVRQLKEKQSGKTAAQIAEIIEYDNQLRKLVLEKSGLDPEILEFLFGRSFDKTLHMFDIKLERKSDRIQRVSIAHRG
jgi:Fe-S-cluster containining protein